MFGSFLEEEPNSQSLLQFCVNFSLRLLLLHSNTLQLGLNGHFMELNLQFALYLYIYFFIYCFKSLVIGALSQQLCP